MNVHHRLDGPADAPALVLSNSLGTSLEMWEGQLPALAERFRIVRYDQRGHGATPAPPGPYTIADLAADALELLERLGLERVSWCGVSLGGMVGLHLGIHAPERIERLALCCTSAHMPPAEQWTERAARVRAQGTAAVADASLERWFTPAAPADLVERAQRDLLATSPEGYAGCCEAIAGHDVRNRLHAIRAPTLVLGARDDPSAPPDGHARPIAEAVDGARLLVLDEGRHLVNVERPDLVTPTLLEHLTAGAAV